MNNYNIFAPIFDIIRMGVIRKRWKKMHPNSDIIPMCSFDFSKVTIGENSYGELSVVDFGGDSFLKIGKFVSIAQKVTFLLNCEHYINHISTYPFRVKMIKSCKYESFGKGDIIIDDDVWIGYGSTILSGVHVGQGAVIAAGSVVTKNVPPYAVVGGNPAKLIKYRFSDELISELLKIDYNNLTKKHVEKYIEELYTELYDVEQLLWMANEKIKL